MCARCCWQSERRLTAMRRLDLDAAKAKTRTAKAEKLPTVSLSLSECAWERRDRGLRIGNHLCACVCVCVLFLCVVMQKDQVLCNI